MIASEKEEIKVSDKTIHSLLRNEVYIYFQCPYDWEVEYTLSTNTEAPNSFGISFQGLSLSHKKTVVCDGVFRRNGYMYLVEVDNTQDMKVNKKKIEKYREVLPAYKEETPYLYFFTQTEARKKKLEEWLKGIRSKVLLYKELK